MLKNILTGLSAKKILDVGTGRGQLINCLIEELQSFDEIIGIDASQKSLDYLNTNFKKEKVKFLKMNGTNLEFEDNSFDMVCISNTLHHLTDDDLSKTLNEMKRVLKPNGYFLVCEMYSDNQTTSQLGHVYLHHFGAYLDRINGICHRETFERKQIISIVNNLGLSIEKTSDFADLNDVCSEEEIDDFNAYIDESLETLIDNPNYNSLKAEGEKAKSWLSTHGLCGATELVILSKKIFN